MRAPYAGAPYVSSATLMGKCDLVKAVTQKRMRISVLLLFLSCYSKKDYVLQIKFQKYETSCAGLGKNYLYFYNFCNNDSIFIYDSFVMLYFCDGLKVVI